MMIRQSRKIFKRCVTVVTLACVCTFLLVMPVVLSAQQPQYDTVPQGEAGISKPQPIGDTGPPSYQEPVQGEMGQGTAQPQTIDGSSGVSTGGEGITTGDPGARVMPTPLDTDGDGYFNYTEDFFQTDIDDPANYPGLSPDTANKQAYPKYREWVASGYRRGRYYFVQGIDPRMAIHGGATAPAKFIQKAPAKYIAQDEHQPATQEILSPQEPSAPEPPEVKQASGFDAGDALLLGGGAIGVGVLLGTLPNMAQETGPNCGPAPTGWGSDWWREYQEWCYCMGGRPYNDYRGMGCDL